VFGLNAEVLAACVTERKQAAAAGASVPQWQQERERRARGSGSATGAFMQHASVLSSAGHVSRDVRPYL